MSPSILRVALVGPLPPPSAGMANQTQQLAQLLARESIEVRVVQTNAALRPAWLEAIRGLRALARLPAYIIRLWRAYGGCDVVHLMANSGGTWYLCAVPAILLARLRGVPVVVNYRGGGAEAFLRRRSWAVKPVMSLATCLIVPSGFLQDVFARFAMTASVVPNVVDLRRFTPATTGSATDAPHLIVTRNLEAIYDNATALRAFKEVVQRFPRARMTVAGEGSLRDQLQDLAAALGIDTQVTFSGRLERDQMADLYRSASVFINPSRVDNMPNSVLEALASGVPVVSTNVGGVPFVVEHERTALLVQPQDPEALARAILRVLQSPALAAGLVGAGLDTVRRYEWARIRPLLLACYEQAAHSIHRAGTRTT